MEPIYYARQALDCLYTGPYYYVNYFITLREEINVWYCFIYFYVFVVQRKDKVSLFSINNFMCQPYRGWFIDYLKTERKQTFFCFNFCCTKQHYCAFHKHANSKVQKSPSQLRFSLPSIIITITSNEPWNRNTQNEIHQSPITSHDLRVTFCFLRGPLRWLTAAKNATVSSEFACLWKAQ